MCFGTNTELSDVLELNSIMAYLSTSLHSTINIGKHIQFISSPVQVIYTHCFFLCTSSIERLYLLIGSVKSFKIGQSISPRLGIRSTGMKHEGIKSTGG